ncbi:MAG: pantoate kinase [Haloferacaceae archaeon]
MPTARAFVPGHVTGFFGAYPDDDPRVAGSRGAGLTLSRGVETTVSTEGEPEDGVYLNGEASAVAPVERVLDALDAPPVRVELTSELPVGTGFGVSGAAALGTALAASALSPTARTVDDLVSVAHVAEVESGTGLGDVVAQARGGAPLRLAPGDPDRGRVDALPVPRETRVEWVVFGDRSTESVLGGDTARLTAAGERALAALRAAPSLGGFLRESWRFTRAAGLATDRVRETVAAADGPATMAMLGHTVFGVGRALSGAGFSPEAARLGAGARLEHVDGTDDF